VKGEGRRFYSPEEVIIAYNEGQLDLHAKIEGAGSREDEEGNLVTRLMERPPDG
jgi:DNA-directed RNA polymerase subunit beta'